MTQKCQADSCRKEAAGPPAPDPAGDGRMQEQGCLNAQCNVRILAIDDNEQIHADFRKILGADGAPPPSFNSSKAAFLGEQCVAPAWKPFDIDSAYQGQEGLEMVCQALQKGRPYAMAFVDIRMPPGWDGIETVKRLWQEDPDLQVVICTAYSDYSWDEMIKELGQSDQLLILKKPFDNIEVRQLASALTRKWCLTRQSRLKKDELERMVQQRTIALANSEAQMRAIIESAHECIVSIDHTGKITEFNPAAQSTFGYARTAAIGRYLSELIIPPAQHTAHRRGLERYLATGESRVLNKRIELSAQRRDGTQIPVEATITAIQHSDAPPNFTAILRDIRERKRAEEKLRHDALHDALTGLPNRALFIDRLTGVIQRSARSKDRLFAVLFLDLDRFKNVNDSLGHLIGDKLLVDASRRLLQCVRASDTIARLGGDEFAILVDGIRDVSDAVRIAQRIHETMSWPFHVDGEELFTTTSIGIALSSTGYDRAEDILRDADTAMYRAKADGKACYRLFSPEMHNSARQTLELENDLRRAIGQHEFRTYYQPIVLLETERVAGFEALVRWQHPVRGLMEPEDFIKVAEDTGSIVPIGWQVLREACDQLRQWQEQCPETDGLTLNVNVSPRQLAEPDLLDRIDRIVDECGIDAHRLALEVTEESMIQNARSASAVLSELKSMGIRLCIDDFATGYASLSYLYQFPFDTLKIDRTFIPRADTQQENWHIVRAIVDLAHNLGMTVVAEGVETAEQRERLKALQCDFAQGYLFSRPVDQQAASALLARQAPPSLPGAAASPCGVPEPSCMTPSWGMR